MNPSPPLPGSLLCLLLTAIASAQQPPAVTRLEPAHLATGLTAASIERLVVHFDQDMDPALHSLCGGGASFPRTLRTQWQDARTFVLDVELVADRVYSMDLACPGSNGFRAKNGGMLRPTPWRIATSGATLPDGVPAMVAGRLFAAIRDHYSYRDRLGIDWAELEQKSREALTTAKDGPALASWATEVLGNAQDPHVTVRWQECVLPTYRRSGNANFDMAGLQKVLPKLNRVGRTGLTGRTDDGIGYLLLSTFARDSREEIEQAVQALRSLRDCKALVLDVRTNGGGDELLAQRVAAFFVQGEVAYAKHRTRDPKAPDGFRAVETRTLRGNAKPDVFDKPVAVLMGPLNMSSCEAFLLMMKQAPQAVLVGATSYGSSGNPQSHTLLPGLIVQLPSWQAMRPDGSMIEGEGIEPHLHVDATPAQLAADDLVLAAALARLRRPR